MPIALGDMGVTLVLLAGSSKNEAVGLWMPLFGGLKCLTRDFSVTASPNRRYPLVLVASSGDHDTNWTATLGISAGAGQSCSEN